MLNKEVQNVLSQVNAVTNSLILRFPETVAVSESQDMMIRFNLENLDPDPFEPIPLKDSLADLLNLLKLFPEDRSVEILDNTINVSNGDIASSFIMDNIALMEAYDKKVDQFDKTEAVPGVATFNLTTSDIKNLKSATGVFKDLSEIIITSEDDDVTVRLGATNKFNARSNTFSVSKEGVASKNFQVKIPVDNFKMLPVSDYTVEVKYNSSRDSYRILMKNKSLEGFHVMMAVKVS